MSGRLCIGPCGACGDPAYRKHRDRPLCQECFAEIVYGELPRISPIVPRITGVEPTDEAAKHDAAYHGGRFHSGEW